MSARTGEWHLLGESSDPVPGEYWEIRDEGDHYTKVAADIRTQVTALRNLADDDVSKGAYLDSIRENCEDTAGDLEKVLGRFETVGSQLTSWATDVETARSETWAALQDAEDADATLRSNPEPAPPLPGADPLTGAEQAEVDRVTQARSGATQALSAARTRFSSAMSTYNSEAEKVASAIRKASDDDMKDSRWDKVKNWVSQNADWLKLVADIIGWIVLVVAVVALFCTPAGWIMLLVAAVAVLGVGIRALLAASGEGSWADFAFDLVGVLTLGTGKIATSLARLGRNGVLRQVGRHAGNLARTKVTTALLNQFKNAPLLSKPGTWLFRTNPAMRWLAGRSAYTEARLAWLTRPLPELRLSEKLLAGGDDVAGAMRKEIAGIMKEFPEIVIKGDYTTWSNVAVNIARTGASIDLIDKTLGDSFSTWDEAFGIDVDGWADGGKPGWGPYGDAKDHFSYGPGGHLG
jgi:hypothetical protein